MNDYNKIAALYSRTIEDVENGKIGVYIMKYMTHCCGGAEKISEYSISNRTDFEALMKTIL